MFCITSQSLFFYDFLKQLFVKIVYEIASEKQRAFHQKF